MWRHIGRHDCVTRVMHLTSQETSAIAGKHQKVEESRNGLPIELSDRA